MPAGKMRGPIVVVGAQRSKRGEPRLLAVTRERKLVRLTTRDFARPPRPVGNLPLAPPGDLRQKTPSSVDPEMRKRLASALAALDLPAEAWEPEPLPEEREGGDLSRLRAKVLSHPCHRCPDLELHSQWAARAARLASENDQLRKRVRGRTETLSRKFHRVLEVLEEFGYVSGFELAPKGWMLARVYNESDLLVAETLANGWLDGLKPAELAAVVSAFVFESRGPFEVVGSLPTVNTGHGDRLRGHRLPMVPGGGPRGDPRRRGPDGGGLHPELQADDRPAPPTPGGDGGAGAAGGSRQGGRWPQPGRRGLRRSDLKVSVKKCPHQPF
ncbi:MAG: hypothetical protein E6G66_10660 [Actinobacteria bacterium]|nr:MAG: hypothetical protein E6G66_10660 [Actinomycetota bacterium]